MADAQSRTLAIVVLALDSFTVLYEGLTHRTLQRRVKFAGTDAFDASAMSFVDLSRRVIGAIVADQATLKNDEAWLNCELGRGEASLTLHQSNARCHFTVTFDLSSLDRNEAPPFLREHLLDPLAALALKSLSEGGARSTAPSNRQGVTALSELFGKGASRDAFARYTQSPCDVQPATVAGPQSASNLEQKRTAGSIITSDDHSSLPTRGSPATPAKTPTTNRRGAKLNSSVHRRPESDEGEKSQGGEDEMMVFRPTPSSSTSRASRSSRYSALPSGSSGRDAQEHLRHRSASTSPSPKKPGVRQGKSLPATGDDSDNSGTDSEGDDASGTRDEAAGVTSTEQDIFRLAAPERTALDSSLDGSPSRSSQVEQEQDLTLTSFAVPAPEPSFQSATTPQPARSERSTSRTSTRDLAASAPTAAAESQDAKTEDSHASTSTTISATAGPKEGGRGASSYRRGLAKRQRI